MSPRKKGRPALNQHLQSKQAGGGIPLLRSTRISEKVPSYKQLYTGLSYHLDYFHLNTYETRQRICTMFRDSFASGKKGICP
ncbi:hypothetical protein J6590_090110 [Homalodisca vitripennis]|nr:hypothetical protein J6590_090110 [Homalodisca vitripennis]